VAYLTILCLQPCERAESYLVLSSHATSSESREKCGILAKTRGVATLCDWRLTMLSTWGLVWYLLLQGSLRADYNEAAAKCLHWFEDRWPPLDARRNGDASLRVICWPIWVFAKVFFWPTQSSVLSQAVRPLRFKA